MVARFVADLPGVTQADLHRVELIEPESAAALEATKDAPGFAATQLGQLYEKLPAGVKARVDEVRRWFQDWFDGYTTRASAVLRQSMRWWVVPAAELAVADGDTGCARPTTATWRRGSTACARWATTSTASASPCGSPVVTLSTGRPSRAS